MNNPWFRVKVHKVEGRLNNEIWFEHPTRVEETAGTFYPNGESMHLTNGEVASPGWAERLHADYSAAYQPREKHDEQPDPKTGWEGEVAYRLGAQIMHKGGAGKEAKVRTQRKLPTITNATLKKNTDKLWMAIHGLVYDVTKYMGEHPGGGQILEAVSGKDATYEFEEAGHTVLSRREVDRLVLHGVLEGWEDFVNKLIAQGWVEEDGIPTIAQVDAIKKAAHDPAGGAMEKFAKSGIPVALSPGKKIPLKLAER